MDDPCKKCNGHCNNYYVCEPKEQYDKCMTCANRVVASPECIKCDGEENYKPVEQTLQKPFESDSTKKR